MRVAGSSSLGVTFANTDIGTQLAQVASSSSARRARRTRQIFFCSQGGYDTHSNQLPLQVTLYSNLAAALAAFDQAMGVLSVENNVTAFTESDFSRTSSPTATPAATTDGQPRPGHGRRRERRQPVRRVPTLTLSGPDDSGSAAPGSPASPPTSTLAPWRNGSAWRKRTWTTSSRTCTISGIDAGVCVAPRPLICSSAFGPGMPGPTPHHPCTPRRMLPATSRCRLCTHSDRFAPAFTAGHLDPGHKTL